MPASRHRAGQGALQRILEPLVDADCHAGASGDRPKRTAPPAVDRGAEALGRHKTRVLDGALAAYFDRVRHDRRRAKGDRRGQDRDTLHVLKLILNAAGKRGGPQSGGRSPGSATAPVPRWRRW
jgi:RNA-directed DNA polymerase